MAETVPFGSEPSSSSSQKLPQDSLKQPQVPAFTNFPPFPNGYYQMFPAMYPALVPPQNDEQVNRGAGIYAVCGHPFNGNVTGLPYNTLIPLTYRTPTRPSPETSAGSENQGQTGQQHPLPPLRVPERQVVRRFQIAFRIDLLLMLKLAAVIFLFNQDGSRQRLAVLVFSAVLVYLYQTGSLSPIIRWLSQGMQRAAAPPLPPRAVPRVDIPGARQGVDNAAPAEGQPEAENGNQPINDADWAVENGNAAEPGGGNGGNQWWGIVKEIQMIVFGFITSLLPGFHNHMD
ncbi:hypothetical protein TanjilG_16722 [Lupinus angustifolius]|uniref:Uncharacterized protein n=1 Tax=Lupinus angustifolius TaxID=3871 RepID=A0A4P1QZU6_LUPAN|nr:PREDICTED: uncharacterized protein LOC109327183 [Lupinus angustifolius]OIV98395.1 hypothetical protein TanjilG_16722 [Lupinus angustifolius]